jgi:hypothetical protein
MTIPGKRELFCVLACGLLLSACSSLASTQNVKSHRLLEAAACKLVSAPPALTQTTGSFEAVSAPIATLNALKKTGDRSLQDVVRAYNAAADVQNTVAMIRALANGVKECHSLGLRTGP